MGIGDRVLVDGKRGIIFQISNESLEDEILPLGVVFMDDGEVNYFTESQVIVLAKASYQVV